jgi:hypothetical protein
MAIFVSYCPQFWGSGVIYKANDTQYMFERHDQNSSFLHFWPFHELLHIVLGFQGDLQGPWHSVHVWEAWPKTHPCCIYGCFRELLPTILGF